MIVQGNPVRLLSWFSVAILLTGCVSLSDSSGFQNELDKIVEEYRIPGITAAYVGPDGTSVVAASGLENVKSGAVMQPDSRMLAASIGKTMVAATVLSLWQEGVVDLDAPASHWLGDRQWFSRLANHQEFTIRQLLGHRSGLPDHVYSQKFGNDLADEWRNPGNPFTPERLLSYIFDQPALFSPGNGFAYSDSGYILLGLIIEEATGQDYYRLIQDRFLEPLGLTLTSPSNSRTLPGLVAGYTTEDNPFGIPSRSLTATGRLTWHPGLEWTGGGLVSNSRDLARWGHALFNGQAMAGDYLVQMLDTAPLDSRDRRRRYGLGVAEFVDGGFGPEYGHAGWIPGYSSSLRHYPDYNVTIAFQINTDIGLTGGDADNMGAIEARLADLLMD